MMTNIKEILLNLFAQSRDFWGQQSSKAKTMYIASLLIIVLAATGGGFLLNRVSYAVLYQGLDATEATQIMARLTELGVSAQVDDAGTITVPKGDEARLKMQLSSEGFPKTALTYDTFQNNANFMTTDFEKRKYLLFQLQDRLQASIKTLSSINNAIVTISLPEQDSFVIEADRVPPSASVILELKNGMTLNKSQITGIEELVAKSVPGLTSSNISIMDSTGAALNANHLNAQSLIASTKLDMENQVAASVKERVTALLEPIFGRGGMSIAVNATIDFNKAVSEEIRYNPVVGSTGVIAKINGSSQTVGGSGTSATASGVPGTTSNTTVPTYPQATGTGASGNSTSQQNIDYLVNQVKEQIQKDGGEIKDMSIAIVIDRKDLSVTQAKQVQDMVAFATGIPPAKVSVQKMEFSANKALQQQAAQALTPVAVSESWRKYLIYGLPVLGLLLIGSVVFFLIRKKKRPKGKKQGNQAVERFAQASASRAIQEQQANLPGAIVLNETREQALKKQIKEFSSQNPAIVAQLVKTWLKEEGDRHG